VLSRASPGSAREFGGTADNALRSLLSQSVCSLQCKSQKFLHLEVQIVQQLFSRPARPVSVYLRWMPLQVFLDQLQPSSHPVYPHSLGGSRKGASLTEGASDERTPLRASMLCLPIYSHSGKLDFSSAVS
jgi:hypothetical protein